jgi:hypothetical protein
MPDLSKSAKNPKQAFAQATPRNAFLGMLSDALAQTYAPQRTQQMQGVANFFSVPAIADTLNRLSYGEPLTTGSGGIGGTTRLRPEALEAALAISPFLPKGARLTEGLPVGASIKNVTGIAEDAPANQSLVNAFRQRIDQLRSTPSATIENPSGNFQVALDNGVSVRQMTSPSSYSEIDPENFINPSRRWMLRGLTDDVINSVQNEVRTAEQRSAMLNALREGKTGALQDKNVMAGTPLQNEINQARKNLLTARTGEEAASIINDINNSVQARNFLQNAEQTAIPSWAQNLTRSPLSFGQQPAGESWWKSTMNKEANRRYDEFINQSKDSNLMLYGRQAGSSDIEKIAKHYDVQYEKDQQSIKIINPKTNGYLTIKNADSDAPYISSLKAGSSSVKDGGGKKMYQAAMEWVAQNNKVLVPDPNGITDINEIRKLGNAMSAQIRSGKEFVELNSGSTKGVMTAAEIWKAEARLARKKIPELKNIKFDGNEFNFNNQEIENIISDVDPKFKNGIGVMTAKRAALSKWLEGKNVTTDDVKKAAAALIASGSGAVFAMDKE